MIILRIYYRSFFLAIILFASIFWIYKSRIIGIEPQSFKNMPYQGYIAPDFIATNLIGSQISTLNYKGSVLVLNFWATWCPPCRLEMPAMQIIYELYKAEGLEILAVNTTYQDKIIDVNHFTAEYELTFPILIDENGEISQIYQVRSLPTTFFIDQAGVINNVIYGGPISQALLEINIKNLLRGK